MLFLCLTDQIVKHEADQIVIVVIHDRSLGHIEQCVSKRHLADQHKCAGNDLSLFIRDTSQHVSPVVFDLYPIGALKQIVLITVHDKFIEQCRICIGMELISHKVPPDQKKKPAHRGLTYKW